MPALHIIAKNWMPFKIKVQSQRSTVQSYSVVIRKCCIDLILRTKRWWMMLWNDVNDIYTHGRKYVNIYGGNM